MEPRQKAALNLARLNRFFKSINEEIAVLGYINIYNHIDEFIALEDMRAEIEQYIRKEPDPIFFERVASMGTTEILKDYLEGIRHNANMDSGIIKKLLESVESIHGLAQTYSQELMGKYKGLQPIFANEEAVALFDRSVQAGYLTKEYKPTAMADIEILEFIAFAISKLLNLRMRQKWRPFERQFGFTATDRHLGTLTLSKIGYEKSFAIKAIYPEIDFEELITPKKDNYFFASYGEGK